MCNQCHPYDGLWAMTPDGLRRCLCQRGRDLAETDKQRRENTSAEPVLSTDQATAMVEALSGVVQCVPAAAFARGAIADQLRQMCGSNEQAIWLIGRMGQLYTKWPGTREMRIVFCSKFRPLDAIEVTGESEVFPDGIPSERQLQSPKPAGLLPEPRSGDACSAADSVNVVMEALVVAKRMQPSAKKSVPDIPILPAGVKAISQADIDAAVEQLHQEQGRQQLYGIG